MFRSRHLHASLLALAVLLLPALASAQAPTVISGVVKSETQSPVRGAFVQILTLQMSAVTNDNGFYRLTIPAARATGEVTISVSSIGYKSTERQVSLRPGALSADFVMAEQAVSLDEVVVTGTVGRQEKRAQAAQVSTVSAAKVAEVSPVQSVAGLLQARTPGVMLRNNSGTTGTGSTIRIRGQSSIGLSNEPLVFIDGIRMQSGDRQLYGVGNQSGSALNDIKIEEIESIEVVKGPAAATLYGSDANAGVINIITKKGRQNSAFTQSVTMEYGESDPSFTPPTNYGRCDQAALNAPATFPACVGKSLGTIITDNPLVREQSFGNGRYRNLAWNLRGGGDKFSTFLSLAADDDNGTLPNNEYGHISGRANMDFFVNEKVRLEMGFGLAKTNTQLPRNDNDIYGFLGGGLLGDPRTQGAGKDGWYGFNRHTTALTAYENKDRTIRVQPRLAVQFNPTNWFSNRLTVGGDLGRTRAYSFWAKNDSTWWDDAPRNTGQINEARRLQDRITVDYLGNITRNLGTNLRADISFGTQVQTNKRDDISNQGTGLVNNDVRTVSSAASLTGGSQSINEDRTIGFFGQTQFTFKERLYVQVGGRVDQSSSFGADSKPFYSPKVGISYVISDEAFFRSAIPENVINTLRVRGAYGVTGRAPTSGARSTYSPTTNQVSATAVSIGVTPGATGNPNLKAEKGKELELGFEAGLLRDRLGLELTYFHKKSIDQILSQPLPGSVGAGSPQVNIGAILNEGFEAVATARPITRNNVSLELRGALNTLHNEVLDLGGTPPTTTRKIGFPLSGRWDYRIRSVDVAANKVTVSDTLEFIGNSAELPGWETTGSAILTVFKNLSLYAQIDGRGDRTVYDNTAQFRDRQNGGVGGILGVLGCSAFMPGLDTSVPCTDEAKAKAMRYLGCLGCATAWVTEAWTDTAGVLHPSRTLARNDVSGDYNQSGQFFRLREVSATYRVPRAFLARFARAQTASVTVTMRNINTWTDFTGLDPETDQFLTVPQDKRWTVKFNFTF
jgi:TonB-dependent starch-binding outer membrane protein SusC